jgi:hypothetical protein
VLPAAADRAGPSSWRPQSTQPGTPDSGLDGAESVPIRPLSFRELLDLPFAVIQADIRKLAALGLAGLVLAEDIVVATTVAGSAATQGSDAGTAWSAILSTAVTAWLLRLFLRGLTVPIALAGIHGPPMTWRAAVSRLGNRFGPLLRDRLVSTALGIGLPVVGGLVLLLGLLGTVPLLGWLRGRRLCVVPVLFAEQATYGGAVGRAKILAVGAEWRLAGLWLTLRALFLVVSVPLLGLPLFISDFSGTHRWAVIVLATSGVLLIAAFTEVVDAATSVVGYLDRRCRREAMDVRIPAPANHIPGTTR